MLTDSDFKRIQKLILTLPSKKDFNELRAGVVELKETVRALTVSVEKFVKIAADLKEEHAAISVQLTRHERWFTEIAKKTGISLRV
jgi:hypothetical protein